MSEVSVVENLRQMLLSRLLKSMVAFRTMQKEISKLEDAIGVEYSDIMEELEEYFVDNDEACEDFDGLYAVLTRLKEKSYL